MKFDRPKASTLFSLCGLLLSAVFANPASAIIIVDFQSDTIDPGGQTTIDVLIRSDSGLDEFFLYDPIFKVEPDSANPNTKTTFVQPMDDDFTTSTVPEYVFLGDSDRATSGDPVFKGFVNNDPNTPGETPSFVNAEDFRESLTDLTLGTDPVLLVQIMLQHNLNGVPAETVAGDTFTVTLSSDFVDGDIAFEGFSGSSIAYTVGDPGLITVGAIPEPSTFGFAMIASLGLAYRRRRR